MQYYRAYSFPDSKLFLAIGVRRFTDATSNHFKAMFNICLSVIAPFPENAPAQCHSHSPKNLTSRLTSRRKV